jgi:aryl-alcohol dehydrogenase-like predicted oxidoreductase
MSQPSTQLNHYRLLGNSGMRVSPLCLGTMTFGTEFGMGADREESQKIFDAYADRGGNFIDTANFYNNGLSENFLGQMLQNRRDSLSETLRDRFVISTKYSLNTDPTNPNAGGNHRKSLVCAIEASLKRLGTDYIDLYWLHAWDYRTSIEDVMRALDDMVRQGKILHIGLSDTPAWVVSEAQTIAKLRGWTPVSAIQIEYSLVERTSEADLLPMAWQHGITPTAWSPLGGILSGKYSQADLPEDALSGKKPKAIDLQEGAASSENRGGMLKAMGKLNARTLAIADVAKQIASEVDRTTSQVSLNWLLQQPSKPIPIVGARNVAHLEDNLGALDFTLTTEQIDRLNQASSFALPFPHSFITSGMYKNVVDGKNTIEGGFTAY